MPGADDGEQWLESVAMRPMLEALLESVCKDKPDRMLSYSVVWMRESYPELAEAARKAWRRTFAVASSRSPGQCWTLLLPT